LKNKFLAAENVDIYCINGRMIFSTKCGTELPAEENGTQVYPNMLRVWILFILIFTS